MGLSGPVCQRAGAVHFTVVCVEGMGKPALGLALGLAAPAGAPPWPGAMVLGALPGLAAAPLLLVGAAVWLDATSLGGVAQAATSREVNKTRLINDAEYFTNKLLLKIGRTARLSCFTNRHARPIRTQGDV
jgi:hypothetical protein